MTQSTAQILAEDARVIDAAEDATQARAEAAWDRQYDYELSER
jgi:hypothetical protein